jgi:hypothetical protein
MHLWQDGAAVRLSHMTCRFMSGSPERLRFYLAACRTAYWIAAGGDGGASTGSVLGSGGPRRILFSVNGITALRMPCMIHAAPR